MNAEYNMINSSVGGRSISLSLETIVMLLTAVVLMLTIVLTSRDLEYRLDQRIEAVRLELKADIQRLEDRLLPVVFPRERGITLR